MEKKSYSLLDSGNGRKLEKFGPFVLSRPSAQAVWVPTHSEKEWQSADATFLREGDTKWTFNNAQMGNSWLIEVSNVFFKISPTDFGHLGIFPEQRPFWDWIQETIKQAKSHRKDPIQVLNLFAYSGGSTLAAAKAGAHVCHLDASKGMVSWARENATLNQLTEAPIRWIVEDVTKFLQREIKRGRKYDAIILDPPSFGRGSKGEIFKIEEGIQDLLKSCRLLLSNNPLFVLFSCHTQGFSPIVMHHLLTQMMAGSKGRIDCGEMALTGEKEVLSLPSGTYGRWQHEA